MAERRKPGHAPFLQQRVGEGVVVASGGQAHQMMIGMAALQQHPATQIFAAGAAGHLQQQLRGLFGAAEIGAEEARVQIGNHHQAQTGEMVTFRQHLRAHQHRRRAAPDFRQFGIQTALAAGGVAVDADHRRLAMIT